MSLLILCSLASIAFGISNGSSGRFFIDEYWKTLTEGVGFLVVVRNIRDLRVVTGAFVLSTAFWVYQGTTAAEASYLLGRWGPEFGGWDANDIGVILLIGFALTLVWLSVERGVLKLLPIALLAGIVRTITVTGSRGTLVGLVALLLVAGITVRSVPLIKRLAVGTFFVLILTALSGPAYWAQMRTILNPQEDYNVTSLDGRVPLMKRGVGYAIRYPIFGLGLHNFPLAEGTISRKSWTLGSAVKWSAPHNTYVQVGAETGIPSLILWISLIVSGSYGTWRYGRRIPRWWSKSDRDRRFLFHLTEYLPLAFAGFAISTGFLSFAYLSPSYFLFALLISHRVLVARALREDRARWRAWAGAQEAHDNGLRDANGAGSVPGEGMMLPGVPS